MLMASIWKVLKLPRMVELTDFAAGLLDLHVSEVIFFVVKWPLSNICG